jgi:hypothetical protein
MEAIWPGRSQEKGDPPMKYVPMANDHPFVKQLEAEGEVLNEFSELIHEYYHPENSAWPLYSISVLTNNKKGGIKVGSNRKTDLDAWWEDGPVPYELVPNLVALITRVASQ